MLLKATPITLAFGVLHAVRAASGQNTTSCRCLYGQSCWPSQDDFAQLASQVSQPLVTPSPPAKPCYVDSQSADCAAVHNGWLDGNWRADQPGAMEASNFETYIFPNGTIEACYLNTTLGVPCGQGSVSPIGVDARTIEDVQAAVKFAADHNLRLAVKNTGHDYFGRSNGRGTFMLWTHNMKNTTVHPTFRPAGAPDNVTYEYALTIGAGVQWLGTYEAANAAGRMLPGGIGPGGSVGAAGGWLQGGGHSALSPSYGLGVDNVLEFTVVTSSGENITANAYQNSDLFWALRGGGGGTYGVATSVTYRTQPSAPLVVFTFTSVASDAQSNPAIRQAVSGLVQNTSTLTDAGWGGYTTVTPVNGSIVHWVNLVLPNATIAQANATIGPYFSFIQELAAGSGGSFVVQNASMEAYPSFFAWYEPTFANAQGEVGANNLIGSWLLPRDVLENDFEDVTDTLLGMPNGAQYLMVAGGAVSAVDPDSVGLNPAWRKAGVHVTLIGTWPEGATAAEIDEVQAAVNASNAQLRALAPDSGAYFNEASLQGANFKQAFFGSHYNQLKSIKATYDPLDLFVVTEGVGSDDWDAQLNCRL
ncbi:FAD-binding domain-containing protein [Cubamyces lactineus]|nr:FAD-binding domain-containing protein [Cubamyces lactineus]